MKIPVIDTPDVATQALPVASVGVDAGGLAQAGRGMEAVGQALSQAQGEVAQFFQQEKQKAQNLDTTARVNAYQDAVSPVLTDKDRGILTGVGKEAWDRAHADGGYEQKLQAAQVKALDGVGDPRQRMLIQQHIGQLNRGYEAQINEHLAVARNQYQGQVVEDTQQKSLASIIQRPPLGPDDQVGLENFHSQRSRYESAAQQFAKSPEQLDMMMRNFDAAAARAPLENLISNVKDPEAAQKLLDTPYRLGANGEVTTFRQALGPQAVDVDHQVAALQLQTKGDAQAQDIVARSTNGTGRVMDGAVEAEVDKVPPGPYREKLEQLVAIRVAHGKQAYDQVEQDRKGRVFEGIERGNGFVDESSADWQELNPTDRAAAVERSRTIQRQQRGFDREDRRVQNQTDREELARFSALEAEDRAKVNINTEFPGASQTARFTMQAQQNQVKQKLAKGEGEPLHQFDEQIRSITTQLNLPVGSRDAPGPGAQLKSQMDDWYMGQLRDNNGKAPSREDVEKHLAEQLQQSKGGLFGFGKQYRFQVDPGDSFEPRPPEEQPYGKLKQQTAPTPATAPPKATSQPPPGVKKGSDGKLYQRTPKGWAPYNG